MKKMIIACVAGLLAALCFAQQNTKNAAFNDVCVSISAHKVTKGSFTQTKLIKKISREIKSSGTFIVSVDDGVLWNTQKPFASSMAITKNGIVQTAANGKKSVVSAGSNATFEQVSSLMTSLFNGDAGELEKNFEIEFIGSTANWNVNLVPRDASIKSFIAQIEMAGRATIDSMTLHEPSGDFTKYEFTNQSFTDSLTESEKAGFNAQ
ncbi:MAG: outer membrane lipoprotein carrier protein LolA [Treponema sp.]|nr:outer membrane lipoprotein carrier protein LolA [Treponema sp.]